MGGSSSTQQVSGILSGGFEAKLNKGVLTITKVIDLTHANQTMTLSSTGFLHNTEEGADKDILWLDISQFKGYKDFSNYAVDDNDTVPENISRLKTYPIYQELENMQQSKEQEIKDLNAKIAKLEAEQTTRRLSKKQFDFEANIEVAARKALFKGAKPGPRYYELREIIEGLNPTQREKLNDGKRDMIDDAFTVNQIIYTIFMLELSNDSKLNKGEYENLKDKWSDHETVENDEAETSNETDPILKLLKPIEKDFTLLCEALSGKVVGGISFTDKKITTWDLEEIDCHKDSAKKIYLQLSRKVHPDRHSNSPKETKMLAEKLFQIIDEAYKSFKPKNYDMDADTIAAVAEAGPRRKEMEDARNILC